jgi:hypothetical protein
VRTIVTKLISLLLVALVVAGCGGLSRAAKQRRVCRNVHVNRKLFDLVLAGQPTINVKNATPATVVMSKLGQPDKRLLTRDRLNFWWVYGNTAYFVVPHKAPGRNYIGEKTCDWAFTKPRLRLIGSLRLGSEHVGLP